MFNPEKPEKHVQWLVPADLPFFEGHFPGDPVLPAVAIIDVSVGFLEKLNGKKHVLTGVRNAKFLRRITPGMTVDIAIEKAADDRWKFRWSANEESVVELDLFARA